MKPDTGDLPEGTFTQQDAGELLVLLFCNKSHDLPSPQSSPKHVLSSGGLPIVKKDILYIQSE